AVLSAASATRGGWRTLDLGHGYALQHHPELVIHTRRLESGLATTVGIAVDTRAPEADALASLATLDTGAIDSWLLHTAGAYALLVSDETSVRVFTDPAALMPIFHSRNAAASTPGLIPGLSKDLELASEFSLRSPDEQYTGSLTPYRDVKYLTANHSFDLSSGATRRFWPVPDDQRVSTDEAVARISQLMRRIMAGYYGQGHIVQSLTGGKD